MSDLLKALAQKLRGADCSYPAGHSLCCQPDDRESQALFLWRDEVGLDEVEGKVSGKGDATV